MEKISVTGVILLLGLYTSTLSCPLVSLYGTPRVLQSIAGEKVIPLMNPLEMGRGPNKIPMLAILVTVVMTSLFVLIGRINVLAPIVSMPFLVTYATIDYAFFALSVEHEHTCGGTICSRTPLLAAPSSSQSWNRKSDLDELFPERITRKKIITRSTASSESSSPSDPPGEMPINTVSRSQESLKEECMIGEGVEGENELGDPPPTHPHRSYAPPWLSVFSNKWISLAGALLKICLMFAVNWIYSVTVLISLFLLYYYIATTAPGAPPGIAVNFSIFTYMKHRFLNCIGRQSSTYDEMVITPLHPGVQVTAAHLTKENHDFASRSKIHQSKNYKN